MIHVKTQQAGVVLGTTGSLECDVEAFPRGATSWQTADGKFITSNDTKYQTSHTEHGLYKVCTCLFNLVQWKLSIKNIHILVLTVYLHTRIANGMIIPYFKSQVRMVLNVTRVSKADLTAYYCIAKNALGIVRGQVSFIGK